MTMVRTRFAPSPTGYLHIGGVRTALFNWLFARRHGGQFILRIDDTDRQRNLNEALQPILDGFRWLGIDWDEGPDVGGDRGPYFQSERHGLYREAAATLVERGLAYRDFATAEELDSERGAARKEGRRFIYSRAWMATTPAEGERFAAEGRQAVVRLKMPREGTCRFTDAVRGEVEVEWAREQDHVIQRADGSCLYNLATVVDDLALGISHVIRAEEHLSNTPRQIFIARGLGHEPPRYAHLPFVAEPGSKDKLSKRKLRRYLENPDFAKLYRRGLAIAEAIGVARSDEAFNPVIVDFYEKIGFLPDALVNYLLLLGWSLDDRTEILDRRQMIDHFSLERVNRAPASFDPQKLLAFQGRYMRELEPERKKALSLSFLQKAGKVGRAASPAVEATLEQVLDAAADRIEIGGDILSYADFFTADDELAYDDAAFDKRIRKPAEAGALLRRFREVLARVEPFGAAELEQRVQGFVRDEGISIGKIIHAIRVAVTGKAVGFGLYETLAILGRQRCLARIDRALARRAAESA